jgi:hypothetical protein
MQRRSLSVVGPAARTIALGLLVAVVLIMTLVLAQLAARPAPTRPDPRPPMQFGPSLGHARAM